MTRRETREHPALASLVELGRTAARRPSKEELDAGLTNVRARLEARRGRRWPAWSAWSAATCAVLLLVLGVVRWINPPVAALTYDIRGGTVLEGGYLKESADTGITLTFNEGTRFELAPGTRGRLRSVDEAGVRLGIEHGLASFDVTPSVGRRWLVEVGPFVVAVKGTAFTVSWDPANEQFELQLRHGEVLVSGPVSGGELTLNTGQRLVVSLPKSETLITQLRSDDTRDGSAWNPTPHTTSTVPPAPSEAPSDVSDDKAETELSTAQAPSASRAKSGTERRWGEELAKGRWDSILQDVERVGIQTTLDTASSEDLFILANAARYRRRIDLAARALHAQRRRFPQSPRALDAVFLLGRVEEARGSNVSRALTWYDDYLAHAPTGAYAAEALGRKMTIVGKLSGPAAARSIAKDYLLRFPKGSYAGSARAFLRGD